jgi:homopolymeric O-antigen transport system ATP-binding protein
MPIIQVDHATKEYQLGQLTSLKQAALNTLNRLTGRPVEERKPFKALDDISFSVEQGEVLGIIGHNGAGKSTLLKLLANISKPTSGSVRVQGKVAPLIEVGAGLVGDLTGRENIYLNGAILGIPKAEIDRKFDDIVAFAELEEFIDTPLKRYSSGMSVRVGFAIATAVESDILIVDEVLAVGDLAFQRKCFDRMEELILRQQRTVLMVSHNIRQIERLCTRTLLIDHGRIAAQGSPKDICETFYAQTNAKITLQTQQAQGAGRNVRMTGEVVMESLVLLDEHGQAVDTLKNGAPMTIRAVFVANRSIPASEVVFGFHSTDFVYIASMGTAHLEDRPDLVAGRNVIDCQIERLPLVPGVFGVRIGVLDKYRREMFYGESLKIFAISAGSIPVSKLAALGLVDIPVQWRFQSEALAAAIN